MVAKKSTETANEVIDNKEVLEKENQEMIKLKEENESMMKQMQEMMKQMQEMKDSFKQEQIIPQVVEIKKETVKSVRLMSLSIGQCYLIDGTLSAKFDKMFDIIPIRETVFQDFFYRFRDWFDSLEIVILDEDIAEEYGMKYVYDKHGISETFMNELIKMPSSNMIEHLSSKLARHQLVFVKYFAKCVADKNPEVMDVQKHYALEQYISDTFKFEIKIAEVAKDIIK